MSAEMLRIARFLVSTEAAARAAANPQKLILERSGGGGIGADRDTLAAMARRGLIAKTGSRVGLTDSGVAFLKRNQGRQPDFQSQHRDIEEGVVEIGGELCGATINRAESPLSVIARRKDKDGRRFLTDEEFRAGERLRSDYTHGQLMPRLGANWQASVASGRRSGERGGAAELTDAALSARQRVEGAIRSVGPELAGILIDICCYLKGLETVERERGWPVRSAKIVLKTALGALARHYEPDGGRSHQRHSVTLHWGTADYRPSIQ